MDAVEVVVPAAVDVFIGRGAVKIEDEYEDEYEDKDCRIRGQERPVTGTAGL